MGWIATGVENDPNAQTRLGGYMGGSDSDPNALEDEMRKRLGYLGQSTPTPTLAPWLTGERDTTGNWVNQSRGSQQDAYNIANAMGLGGSTPQQQQLAQAYMQQNAGVKGAVAGAGGGARGAASAQGNALGSLGGNQMSQLLGAKAQQQSDMMQGQALSAQAADALRAGDQGALANKNYQAVQNAQFQQGMSDNDAARQLWAAGQGQAITNTRLGLSNDATNAAVQNAIAQRQLNQQAIGSTLQSVGSLGATAGTYSDGMQKKYGANWNG